MNELTWAKVDTDSIVVSVECATREWVDSWNSDNSDSGYRYLLNDPSWGKGYGGIGSSYDAESQMFIPEKPTTPGDWVFDRERWEWINESAPDTPDGEDSAVS